MDSSSPQPQTPSPAARPSFLIALALALELLVGLGLLFLPNRDVGSHLHTAVLTLLLLAPVPLLFASFARMRPARRTLLLGIGAIAIATQCVVLLFGTGPIYPMVLIFVLIELWNTARSPR